MGQIVQPQRIKRRVLVAFGWNSPRMLRVIGQYARQAGWHLETRQFFNEIIPHHWRGEGLLVSDSQRADLLTFIRRQAPLQPTVVVGGNNPGIRAAQVTEDNHAAGRLAARHFIAQGHKHFAWFTAYTGHIANERRDGFRDALAKDGFACRVLDYRTNRPLVADWLAAQLRDLPRPLACYVLDDQLASELIGICLARGWRVPEDIAVMGTGNIEIACECSHVPITSIDLDEEEMARQAAVLLDRLMRGGRPPRQPVVIAPRGVVVRQSTDYLALTDPALRKAVDHILGNLHRSLSLDQIAAAAGVSRRTLYNLFRRELRRTPVAFLTQARLQRARGILGEKSVAAAAAECGFGSTRTLTRHFQRHEGVSARAWKKSVVTG
jgi:LacI family transcriptional regulator